MESQRFWLALKSRRLNSNGETLSSCLNPASYDHGQIDNG